ncbi:hypothetical protein LOTGIDRAFT_154996 [Lottia gigantea]|uniref:Uncharacterized protein n=1 Tax=Lottia gigantea TaxID=225164 RepID=V4B9E6_LOTGI|nr:hypothetical protein LOTGIDRAFT_154996 [Lottia gigantea]ESO85509.1 hypothetical protein LOTGIDRAFT_154996 [Lottia gigantea]
MANKILDPIFKLYNPIRYSFNKKKENYIIISTTVGSKSQLNDVGRITFKINSLSNWLLLSDAYFRCDFKIKDGTPNENRLPQTNTTLENNFFPSLFSEMVLEAGSKPIETIKHPGEFDTMLKTVLYPKDFVITPSIEVETRIFNSLTKDIEIAFLHRNTVGSMTLTGESTKWPITNTIRPARYLMVGFKNLPDPQTNNNNIFRVATNQTQDPIIHKVQVRFNNDNYPNQPLTINPTTKDYNELYRNYKNMCELFGNPPQFEYVDFALNHPIFCFDLSAHQEDVFKTGVNINIHIEKTQGDVTAAVAATGGTSAAVKAANAKKAADAKAAEERRHNLIIEKKAKGSGVGDMIGTIKEFGKRFGEETKKTVKQGLNNLVHSIDTGEVKVKHKGNGIYFKNIHTGEGLFLSKYKGEGVIFGIK